MRQVLKQLKPDRIEDIIAVVALYRPGPMEQIPSYINRKHKLETLATTSFIRKTIIRDSWNNDISRASYGSSKNNCCFSLAKADLLRRAMGKK